MKIAPRVKDSWWFKGLLGAAMLGLLLLIASPIFAIGVFAALYLHEYAHALVFRACGVPVRGVWMVPPLGAVCVPEKEAAERMTMDDHVRVALAGPVSGVLVWAFAIAMAPVIYDKAHPGEWIKLANGIASFVVINLLPVPILDGGRIVRALLGGHQSRTQTALHGAGIALMLAAAPGFGLTFAAWASVFTLFGCIAFDRNENRSNCLRPGPRRAWTAIYVGSIWLFVLMGVSTT